MTLSVQKLESILGVSVGFATERISELTPREVEVANMLADGMPSREIAAQFGISPKTIDIHRANVMRKLGAKNLAAVVKCILLKRLVDAVGGPNGKEAKHRTRQFAVKLPR
jgi:DNA-binding CsgD family transcriptional regulator